MAVLVVGRELPTSPFCATFRGSRLIAGNLPVPNGLRDPAPLRRSDPLWVVLPAHRERCIQQTDLTDATTQATWPNAGGEPHWPQLRLKVFFPSLRAVADALAVPHLVDVLAHERDPDTFWKGNQESLLGRCRRHMMQRIGRDVFRSCCTAWRRSYRGPRCLPSDAC